jgi:pimeloyl-ACP methyl ester carboxylesterase
MNQKRRQIRRAARRGRKSWLICSQWRIRSLNSCAAATLLASLIGACSIPLVPDAAVAQPSPNDCVVVLHGLVRTSNSMGKLADYLEAAGYRVVNTSYPSREKLIEELAVEYIPPALAKCRGPGIERVHFVTHSMGGILVRYFLENETIDDLGRVVMISPPNQGSEVVDELFDVPGFEALNGPAGYQLGTGDNSLPLQLGPAEFEVGIIAGDYTTNFVFSSMLPGLDDGKVTVERTKLDGMADFIVVHEPHSLIMRDEDVIRQVLYFLQYGRFYREVSGGELGSAVNVDCSIEAVSC